MKIIFFLFLSLSVYGEIVTGEDGKCYEKDGKMYYIVPCSEKKIAENNTNTTDSKHSATNGTKKEKCVYRLGEYRIAYHGLPADNEYAISCEDSLSYIKTMALGYEKQLKINKVGIGNLSVKKGLSKCDIALYYGDFITVGLMSGDRLMCDNFMVYQSSLNRAGRRR